MITARALGEGKMPTFSQQNTGEQLHRWQETLSKPLKMKNMVGDTGIEPVTSCMSSKYPAVIPSRKTSYKIKRKAHLTPLCASRSKTISNHIWPYLTIENANKMPTTCQHFSNIDTRRRAHGGRVPQG